MDLIFLQLNHTLDICYLLIVILMQGFVFLLKMQFDLSFLEFFLMYPLLLLQLFGFLTQNQFLVDYYLIKKSSLSNKDIYSVEADSIYYYSKGWHIKALYSLIIGFTFSASTIWNINLMFLQSYAWIIGAIVSSITYYLLTKR